MKKCPVCEGRGFFRRSVFGGKVRTVRCDHCWDKRVSPQIHESLREENARLKAVLSKLPDKKEMMDLSVQVFREQDKFIMIDLNLLSAIVDILSKRIKGEK